VVDLDNGELKLNRFGVGTEQGMLPLMFCSLIPAVGLFHKTQHVLIERLPIL